MKKTILFTLFFSLFFTMTSPALIFPQAEIQDNERLCRIYDRKADEYRLTMEDDESSQKRLISYQKKAEIYCEQYFVDAHDCIRTTL